MSTSELDFASDKEAQQPLGDSKSALRLQRDMTRVAATAASRAELLAGLLEIAARHSRPLAAFFLERGADGKLGDPQCFGGAMNPAAHAATGSHREWDDKLDHGEVAVVRPVVAVPAEPGLGLELPPTLDRLARQVASAARNACRAGEIEIRRHALPALLAIAAPVPRRGFEPHACGAIFRPAESPAQLALLWQLLVAHIVLWETLHATPEPTTHDTGDGKRPSAPGNLPASSTTTAADSTPQHLAAQHLAAHDSDATIDLMERALSAATIRQAGQALCESLREHLACDRVLIGLRSNDRTACRLAAISQVARFDRRGESIRQMEAAMNETLLRGSSALWPPQAADDRHALLAHKALAESEHAVAVLSTPLPTASGVAIGVVTCVFSSRMANPLADQVRHNGVPAAAVEPRGEATPATWPAAGAAETAAAARLLAIAAPSLALVLDAVRQREGGPATRCWRSLREALKGWRSAALAGAAVACLAALSLPLPYRIACECRVEPAVRRFVVAPHAGVLERVFAKPGEIVEEGQLLARMEDRALRLERPAIEAELHQAAKKRDVALAKNDSSARQIAELEIRQFASKLRLLDDRAEHLELPSPVKGVIASGDLERAEGATLEEGQSLFEIVLLDRMIVEIAVPDGEISHIRPGQPVDVRLDAYPGRAWSATLERVQPRAEIRDEQNVFVAEIELDNADERLRPGMKGRAKVATDRRPLGWILFHKPWEYVVKRLAW
jgi:RND family efflux transporter MFP subunit